MPNSIPFELSWEWTLESELHCGSGLSRLGYADRLVYLNAQGQPEITGDAVKGAIRMSAEQILAWLGKDQSKIYQDQGTAEPKHDLLKAVFGQDAWVRFYPAVLKDAKQSVRKTVRAATALDSQTGIALENSLRQSELVAKGTVFSCRCKIWATPDQQPAIFSFLAAALSATEQIGAKAGTGLGRVRLTACSKELSNWLSEDQLTSMLNFQFNTNTSTMTQPNVNQNMYQWYQLTVTLKEPACLANQPTVGHQSHTDSVLTALTLKGALKRTWQRSGLDAQALLGPKTRWTNAYPVQDTLVAVPIPLSYALEKSETGFGNTYSLHDSFSTQDALLEHNKKRLQWRPMAAGWMAYDPTATKNYHQQFQRVNLPRQITMHVARNYRSRSKRDGALYSREHLTASESQPLVFQAYAYLPTLPAGLQMPSEIYLGKRTSAGHGRAELELKSYTPQSINIDTNQPLRIQLLSPMIYRDPKTGFYKTALNAQDWENLLGETGLEDIQITKCRSQSRVLQSWESAWKHSRSQVMTLVAGSVWELQYSYTGDVTVLQTALQNIMQKGLGEECHQGFGHFMINPPWLGSQVGSVIATTSTATEEPPLKSAVEENTSGKVQHWPGMEGLSWKRINEICEAAQKIKLTATDREKLRAPVQALAARARDPQVTSDSVMAFCKKMATRKNPKGDPRPQAWAGLAEKTRCHEFLKNAIDDTKVDSTKILALRLALETLLICLGEPSSTKSKQEASV